MRRRSAASRLVVLATTATLLSGVLGTTVAEAREGGWQPQYRSADGPTRADGGRRPDRSIRVADLPQSKGGRAATDPRLVPPASDGLAAPIGVSAAPAPVNATTNADPIVGEATSFQGLSHLSRPATSGEPPDPWVAVGPEHVIQAVNTTLRISQRSGTTVQTVDLVDFFGISSIPNYDAAVFDPRVIYDSLHARWIAIESSFDCYPGGASAVGTGYIDVAVSTSADPTGTWLIRSLAFDDEIPDYPGIGTSTDKVVLSSNQFELVPGGGLGCSGGGLLGTYLEVMGWSQLVTTGSVNVTYLPVPGAERFARRPALQTPATTERVFVVSQSSDNSVVYEVISGDAVNGGLDTYAANLSSTDVVAPFANPPAPRQPAGQFLDDAMDARPTDAVWRSNRLSFVSTRPCDPAGGVAETRDCVRVTELNTSTPATPTRVQDFLVAENTFDSYMGGIGYALNGDLHVVWTRSGLAAGAYPSSYGAYQAAAAANNSLSARSQLSAGTGDYPGGRWGDYVGVAQDPQVINAVWQGNQYSAGADYWATEISQLQTGGSSYVPVDPVRVLDTRLGTGLSGVFAANVPRSFKVADTPGIPEEAVAVTGNVTIANQTSAGYVSVTPTQIVNPASSTINFPLGDTRANNITTPLASDGKLAAVYKAAAGRSTHIIVDITGYYLPGDGEATYSTITPTRVLDTRPGIAIGLSGTFLPNTPRTLSVAGAHGIPAEAKAITGNLTVVGQTKAGYLSITPDPTANPTTSTLNFPLGDTRANGVSVPLNDNGDLSLVFKASGGSTHVLLDVTGYYLDSPAGLQFFPLAPGRILDTRPNVKLSGLSGVFTSSSPRVLPVAGHWGVPTTANAVTGNLTVVGQSAAGYVSATLANDPSPATSVLNFPFGDIRANGVALPLNGQGREWFVYKASGGKTTHLILDVSGYFD